MTPDRMADHWWWRPGWRPGRRMYTWHFTFNGQPDIHALAAGYEARLAGLPGLDLVPARWLHLTTQGVGFTDEVSDSDVAAIIDAARSRLAALSPAEVTLGPARVSPEAILLDVAPVTGLEAIRAGLRSAISDVWSSDQVPEAKEWTPHVSVAYSSTTAPAEPYVTALADCEESAESLIEAVQLIVLGRDRHMYEWTTRADIRLSLRCASAR
jgi:2'-5' RNA ligase